MSDRPSVAELLALPFRGLTEETRRLREERNDAVREVRRLRDQVARLNAAVSDEVDRRRLLSTEVAKLRVLRLRVEDWLCGVAGRDDVQRAWRESL